MQSTTSRSPHATSRSSSRSANGLPPTGRRSFGIRSVRGHIRVASPPASTTAWSGAPSSGGFVDITMALG